MPHDEATTTGGVPPVERLYLRRTPAQPADAPPRALPRDSEGQPQRRSDLEDYPLPAAEALEATYAPALQRMERLLPLRVAVLRDHLARTRDALMRYRQVRAEETERQQLFNEDARHAEQVIDAKVAELRAAREREEAFHEACIREALDARARAREVAVVAQAAATGSPGALWQSFQAEDAHDGDYTAETPEEEAPRAEPAPPAEPEAEEAPTAPSTPTPRRGLLPGNWRWPGRRPAAAETEGTPAAPAPAPGEPYRAMQAPHPIRVPFPADEGRERARPAEAIALEQGFLYTSAAEATVHDWQRWLEWPALIACGSIFGVSIGFLTEILDPQMLFQRFDAAWKPLVVVVVIGLAVFWLLGRVVSALAALASEERHSALATLHRDAPDRVGRRLYVSAWVTFGVLLAVAALLVLFEANVEKNGVMGALLSRQANDRIAQGTGAAAAHTIPDWAVWCIVLVVSTPFVLLHAAHGWIAARAATLRAVIHARREREAWHIADLIHQKRDAEAQALHSEELALWREARNAATAARGEAAEAPEEAAREAAGSTVEDATASIARAIDDLWQARLSHDGGEEDLADLSAAPPEEAPEAVPDEAAESWARDMASLMGSPHTPHDGAAAASATATATALRFDDDGSVLLRPTSAETLRAGEAVALAVTRAREAHFRVRMAYARKREALARIDAGIARWEAQRAAERQELEAESVRRIEDAHAAYVATARAFDRLFREEREHYERLAAPGWVYRLWGALFHPGIDA